MQVHLISLGKVTVPAVVYLHNCSSNH